ncbi:MAG TPA: hypothetical protein VLY20_09990 [Nitrospiria bacterium]|nr:hypothetical protein [Nitrospiria bacterium]
MITGLNTDVEHQGKIYHVQTEDTGRKTATIVTILFQAGAILASRKTAYADIVNAENLPATLKDMMNEQHKKMIEDLQTGRVSLETSRPGTKPAAVQPPAASKAPEHRPPPASGGKKSLDDMILDYLAAREERKKP